MVPTPPEVIIQLVASKGEKAEALLNEAQELAGAGNYSEVIRVTTEGIKNAREFFAATTLVMNVPGIEAEYGWCLLSLYGLRAMARYAIGSNPKDKELLKLALEDVEEALRFPNAYYTNAKPSLRSQLETLREDINKDLSGCFIATATYGSTLAPEVATLRRFRDVKLRRNRIGREIIRIYERYSPPLADWISKHSIVRLWVQRLVLSPIVWVAHHWEA